MVTIRAFSGLRYDLERAGGAGGLLAPPYDVIDDASRQLLAARSAHNCVHVILPEGEGEQKYANGAGRFRKLVAEALVRDAEPGFYVYHQSFTIEGRAYTRKGFIGLVELTPFGDGPVLAHERTLAGPKRDRLALMRACEAHLELVFGLFSDPGRAWEAAVSDTLGEPVLECDFEDAHHVLYRVYDPRACVTLGEVLAGRNIYIADGHHRYETMCAYRRELEAAGGGEAARLGLIYLSNLDDEGLVVLPTHRLVHGLEEVDLPGMLASLVPHFDVSEQALPGDLAELRSLVAEAGEGGAAFGLSRPRSARLHLVRLRRDFSPGAAGLGNLAPALQRLDVSLLHELVLERGLGITKQAQADKSNLSYLKSSEAAFAIARDGDERTQLCCFMNAARVHDVVAVCDSGEVMPQKSTFFYPKIPTGLVFHDLSSAPE